MPFQQQRNLSMNNKAQLSAALTFLSVGLFFPQMFRSIRADGNSDRVVETEQRRAAGVTVTIRTLTPR